MAIGTPLDSPFTELDPADRPLVGIDRFARLTAKVSLIGGIAILLIFVVSGRFEVALIGYAYLVLAAVFNTVVLLIIIFSMLSHPDRRRHHWETIGRLALNIPIAIACAVLGIVLMEHL